MCCSMVYVHVYRHTPGICIFTVRIIEKRGETQRAGSSSADIRYRFGHEKAKNGRRLYLGLVEGTIDCNISIEALLILRLL